MLAGSQPRPSLAGAFFLSAAGSAWQQTATLVVAHLAQAASTGSGGRLDRGGLLPCAPHEKIGNRFEGIFHRDGIFDIL